MIHIEDLFLSQGQFHLREVSLEIPAGSYGVLMGKTGSGKSTILEAVAGLRPTKSGRIHLHGANVTNLSPSLRNVGYVPQDAALFQRYTVSGNLGFALQLRRVPQLEINARVKELADWLGLTHLLNRYPQGLSGGEAQRVALGRALAFHPPVLLLDEPLSALDEETREQLLLILDSLKKRRAVTVLHVTHHRLEAERLADVLLRMHEGKVQLIPKPALLPPESYDEGVKILR